MQKGTGVFLPRTTNQPNRLPVSTAGAAGAPSTTCVLASNEPDSGVCHAHEDRNGISGSALADFPTTSHGPLWLNPPWEAGSSALSRHSSEDLASPYPAVARVRWSLDNGTTNTQRPPKAHSLYARRSVTFPSAGHDQMATQQTAAAGGAVGAVSIGQPWLCGPQDCSTVPLAPVQMQGWPQPQSRGSCASDHILQLISASDERLPADILARPNSAQVPQGPGACSSNNPGWDDALAARTYVQPGPAVTAARTASAPVACRWDIAGQARQYTGCVPSSLQGSSAEPLPDPAAALLLLQQCQSPPATAAGVDGRSSALPVVKDRSLMMAALQRMTNSSPLPGPIGLGPGLLSGPLFLSSPLATATAVGAGVGADVGAGSVIDTQLMTEDEIAALAAALAQDKMAQIEQLKALQQLLRDQVIDLLPLI